MSSRRPSLRAYLLALLLLGCLGASSGCSSYDPAALEQQSEYQALGKRWGGASAHPGSILLARIAPYRASALDPDEPRGPIPCDPRALEGALLQGLGRVLGEGQRVALAPEGVDPAHYAAEQGFELVLELEVTRWNSLFLETTGWWYPNALFISWYFWPFGAWTIADEVYGIDCQVALSLKDAASERPVPGLEALTLELVSGPEPERAPSELEISHLPRLVLSDGERGLDFFGTWSPGSLDPDQWTEVATRLGPYAARHASVRVAARVAQALSRDRADGARARRYATTHAVVVGIGEYAGRSAAGARADAEGVAQLLGGVASVGSATPAQGSGSGSGAWLPPKNLATFWGSQASVAQVESAARAAAGRARAEDTLLFYFAGRGQSGSGLGLDALSLACDDGELSLARLAAALEGSAARRRVVILDCDFREGPRGSGAEPALSGEDLREALRGLLASSQGQGLVILASDPTDARQRTQTSALEGQGGGQEQGLLTTYLLRALRGDADSGGDGLSGGDLRDYLERHVGNLSEVALEWSQHPLVVLQDPGALLEASR